MFLFWKIEHISVNTVCVWVLSSGGAVGQSRCVSWDSRAGLWACVCSEWCACGHLCCAGRYSRIRIWVCIHICTGISVSFLPNSLKYPGSQPHNSKELFPPFHAKFRDSEVITALLLHSLEVELSLPLSPGMFSCLYTPPDKFWAPRFYGNALVLTHFLWSSYIFWWHLRHI